MNLELSIVVCTHDRPRDLARCLDGLTALADSAEIIVVDSASNPSCASLVHSYQGKLPSLRYVREDVPGLSRARNRGIAEARGKIVAFLDDDATPRAEWAGQLVAPFDADSSVGCVGGACVAAFEDDAQRPRWLSDRLLQFSGVTRFGAQAREARSSSEWPFGANIAFRVQALPADGPFAEELGRNADILLSGEESDLVERVQAAGWKIWLAPEAVVEHTVRAERCTSRYYWRRLWWAGVSRARSTESATALALRLVAAVPIRVCLYALTRDRVYLYRTAETAGFIAERARLLSRVA
jgi:glucosyl-dolichyl phosphate glucuronosyltransferase